LLVRLTLNRYHSLSQYCFGSTPGHGNWYLETVLRTIAGVSVWTKVKWYCLVCLHFTQSVTGRSKPRSNRASPPQLLPPQVPNNKRQVKLIVSSTVICNESRRGFYTPATAIYALSSDKDQISPPYTSLTRSRFLRTTQTQQQPCHISPH